MIYLPELFYLQDQEDFPFQKAVTVTAKTTARWCSHFLARLLAPLHKSIAPVERKGMLPATPTEREVFVEELVQWIFAHSFTDELFCLILDDQPIQQTGQAAKFAHPDDTCCWLLNLTEGEFAALQEAWRQNALPDNLFYPQQESICIPPLGSQLKARLFRWLGIQKCYTPLQWQMRDKKEL